MSSTSRRTPSLARPGEVTASAERMPLPSGDAGVTHSATSDVCGSQASRAPRRRLRTQLTFGFASVLTLVSALSVVVSCGSSAATGVALLVVIGLVTGMICAATLGAWLVIGRALRPLAQLAACADHLDGSWVNTSVTVDGDQSEVHMARSALDGALARLRESQNALNLFVANVAHELQDPVAAVLAESQVLAAGAQSPEAMASFACSVREELTRISKIIAGSLTLARLDSARDHKSLDPVSMLDIALGVVKNVNMLAQQQSVRVVLLLPEADDLQVRCDADLVTSMLENVVTNAVAHSPRGEEIRIRLERAADDLSITIRDRGPGVPEQLLPRILDARVHGAGASRGARGRGLGLAIADRVARYHGGAIRIGNHVEGGCQVEIALPLHGPRPSQESDRRHARQMATA